MLAASVAAGVTAAFVAPIGGVLFSIEVTSTYYMVNHLWKAFFWGGWTILTLKILGLIHPISYFFRTDLVNLDFDFQYIAYIILAVLWGIIGSLMIIVINNLINIRNKFSPIFRRWVLWIGVVLLVSSLSYPFDILLSSDKTMLQGMFSLTPLKDQEDMYAKDSSIMLLLFLFLVLKFFVITLGLSLPIPAGISTPSLLIGAVFGRFFLDIH